MNKLLAIVGPTATGKTNLALKLSIQQPSILISADSRQVYKGMDIVTGKDHPKDVTIYGIDLISPNESCSVAIWHSAVYPHIIKAWENGILPIIVGGTGLYVKALTEGIATMSVPINQALRAELVNNSIAQLQAQLISLSQDKFNSMNNSDQHNPRRLIRAIEVASSPHNTHQSSIVNPKSEMIGLYYSSQSIQEDMIRERVIQRLSLGAIEETKLLITRYGTNLQSLSAIGYKTIIDYLNHLISQDQMIELWVKGELDYAKRQMTWFRKQRVVWHDRGIIDIEEIII